MVQKKRLGELLIEAGVIDNFQLQSALGHQRQWGGKLGRILVENRFLTEETLVRALSRLLNIGSVDLALMSIHERVLKMVPVDLAERYGVLPIGLKRDSGGEFLYIAMSDPTNLEAIDNIQFKTGKKVRPMIAADSAIELAIRQYYYGEKPVSISITDDAQVQFSGRDVTADLATQTAWASGQAPPQGGGPAPGQIAQQLAPVVLAAPHVPGQPPSAPAANGDAIPVVTGTPSTVPGGSDWFLPQDRGAQGAPPAADGGAPSPLFGPPGSFLGPADSGVHGIDRSRLQHLAEDFAPTEPHRVVPSAAPPPPSPPAAGAAVAPPQAPAPAPASQPPAPAQAHQAHARAPAPQPPAAPPAPHAPASVPAAPARPQSAAPPAPAPAPAPQAPPQAAAPPAPAPAPAPPAPPRVAAPPAPAPAPAPQAPPHTAAPLAAAGPPLDVDDDQIVTIDEDQITAIDDDEIIEIDTDDVTEMEASEVREQAPAPQQAAPAAPQPQPTAQMPPAPQTRAPSQATASSTVLVDPSLFEPQLRPVPPQAPVAPPPAKPAAAPRPAPPAPAAETVSAQAPPPAAGKVETTRAPAPPSQDGVGQMDWSVPEEATLPPPPPRRQAANQGGSPPRREAAPPPQWTPQPEAEEGAWVDPTPAQPPLSARSTAAAEPPTELNDEEPPTFQLDEVPDNLPTVQLDQLKAQMAADADSAEVAAGIAVSDEVDAFSFTDLDLSLPEAPEGDVAEADEADGGLEVEEEEPPTHVELVEPAADDEYGETDEPTSPGVPLPRRDEETSPEKLQAEPEEEVSDEDTDKRRASAGEARGDRLEPLLTRVSAASLPALVRLMVDKGLISEDELAGILAREE